MKSVETTGLESFAERSRIELRASGERVRKKVTGHPEPLTPREAQIAELVTEGEGNRQIAAQLFVSPSTVEYHLGKVFRKLGVTSRTQLIHHLSDDSSSDGGGVSRAGPGDETDSPGSHTLTTATSFVGRAGRTVDFGDSADAIAHLASDASPITATVSLPTRPEDSPMLTSISTSLLWRGILAIVIGATAVAWPDITVGAFVILFAAYSFMVAAADGVRAFSRRGAGSILGYLLLSLLSAAAGVIALVWPDITALVLTLWVAGWAFVTGAIEVTLAFRGEGAGERAMWALGGFISMAFGVVLAIRPDSCALTLATVFGLFSIVSGTSALVLSAQLRHTHAAVERQASTTAPERTPADYSAH